MSDGLEAKLTAISLEIYFAGHAERYRDLAVERTRARRARVLAGGISDRVQQGQQANRGSTAGGGSLHGAITAEAPRSRGARDEP